MTMFKQPCLIKKNTKTLRSKLEKMGYQYAPLRSQRSTYDNLKDPWIVCIYDIYTCVDSIFFEDLKDEVKALASNPDAQSMGLSTEFQYFSRQQEDQFLECASQK